MALIEATTLLRDIGLRPGMHIADFGAGRAGHFIFPASQIVGEGGVVYAVDVVKDVLSMIEGRKKLFQLLNIKTVWADFEREGGVAIPEHSLDFVLLVNNLWCVESVSATTNEIRRVLKEDGRLCVVDWRRSVTHPAAPAQADRLDAMQAEAQLLREGFDKVRDLKAGPYHWGILTKPL